MHTLTHPTLEAQRPALLLRFFQSSAPQLTTYNFTVNATTTSPAKATMSVLFPNATARTGDWAWLTLNMTDAVNATSYSVKGVTLSAYGKGLWSSMHTRLGKL